MISKRTSEPALLSKPMRTGWREDGLNGYIWSVCTPTIRFYEYHHSRAGEVVKRLIGDDFSGVLGSDFYGGYNIHQGLHQRCWVHFLRDIHDLKKEHPDDAQVWQWAKQVKQIYERAKAAPAPDPQLPPLTQHTQRVALQHAFEQELWHVCAPFAHTQAPMRTLCERVERFLPELFVFVAYPGVPSDNNLAERSVRPDGSSRAKSVEEHAALKAVLPAWDWRASLALGKLKVSILSLSALLS
jgi:transposase